MTLEQEREAEKDFRDFMAAVKANPQKTYTLRMVGKKGEYQGGGIQVDKPGGMRLGLLE